MASKFSLGGVCVAAALALTATNANAAVLLTFGQAGQGAQVTATNTSSTTEIAASNVAVNITQLFGTGATPMSALLTLDADSDGPAGTAFGQVGQFFNGTFSILSTTGYNYLSGVFQGFTIGQEAGGSYTLQGSEPGSSVTFTSDYFGTVLAPRAVSFSFADVTPGASICGDAATPTLCGFQSSVSGTFSGNPVPEPATWGMMILGFGAVGFAMRRRREKVSVRFA